MQFSILVMVLTSRYLGPGMIVRSATEAEIIVSEATAP